MFFEFLNFSLSHFIFCYLRVLNGTSFPPPLDPKEEKRLFYEIKKNPESEARDLLIEHNLRLVAHIIKKYDTDRNDAEDLISIGTIGLIKAIDSYDPDQGTRFATYAGKCVQNEILMYFRAQKKYASQISLAEPIEVDKEGNPLTILDVMQIEDTVIDQIHLKNRTALALEAIRVCLNERERMILSMRYGLGKRKCTTQREIADQLGISRSYVSRIEKAALSKMREHMEKPRNYI